MQGAGRAPERVIHVELDAMAPVPGDVAMAQRVEERTAEHGGTVVAASTRSRRLRRRGCKGGPVRTLHDDLGTAVPFERPPERIVSLVPSITEAIAATSPERLVGATDWCVQPPGLDVARVRGTKNPDRAAIAALAPDLVVANQEENRAVDVERLRTAGVPVWVTRVESVPEALVSLGRLVREVLAQPTPEWLESAEWVWSAPAPSPVRTAVAPIWRDPWMVVGPRTYADDLLRRIGIDNLVGSRDDLGERSSVGGDRYPRVALDHLLALHPDVVILPDEPYAFSPSDGPEAFPGLACGLVSGRALTWYGPAMVGAPAELAAAISGAAPREEA